MSKISQGKYELFTTKADAIDKFMQMQGVCREEINDGYSIHFYCSKKGRIVITNPPGRNRLQNAHSTELFANVVEQAGKTYVTYYTVFNRSINILKAIFLTIDFIMFIVAVIFAINKTDISFLLIAIFCLTALVFNLFSIAKEKNNSTKDSETLIKELEKRIEAVNHWDK